MGVESCVDIFFIDTNINDQMLKNRQTINSSEAEGPQQSGISVVKSHSSANPKIILVVLFIFIYGLLMLASHAKTAPIPPIENAATLRGFDQSIPIVSTTEELTPKLPLPIIQESLLTITKEEMVEDPVEVPSIELLSQNCPAQADVLGNLGPPSSITSEEVSDWLADRWQAAKNMRGEPIPGKHWVMIDLQRLCKIKRLLIDWEDAYSDDWVIMGGINKPIQADSSALFQQHGGQLALDHTKRLLLEANSQPVEWINILASSSNPKTTTQRKHHIIQELPVISSELNTRIQFIKLVINTPRTKWGSSVWRLQVWGESTDRQQSWCNMPFVS